MVWMIIFTSLKAQTVPHSLDKKVRVPAKEVNIIALGDLITAQTGLILSFNAQTIIAQKQLWLRQPSYSIHQLLSMIKEVTGAEYTIYREHVIFHRIVIHSKAAQTAMVNHPTKPTTTPATNQEQQIHTGVKQVKMMVNKISGSMIPHTSGQPMQTRTQKPLLSGSHTNELAAVQTARSSNESNGIDQGINAADHTTAATGMTSKVISETPNGIANNPGTADSRLQYPLSYLTSQAITIPPVRPARPALLQINSLMPKEQPRHQYEKPGLFKPFAQAGFAADEVLYVHLQAKAGITLAYGIVSWSSNFSVSGFRYGVGSSYPLKNGWLIQLEATTGKLSKETLVRTNLDTATTRYPIRVDSRLRRISLFAQKSVAPHLSMYAGPVFNHLKSTYRFSTFPTSLESIKQGISASEKDYSTIIPPYTLSSSPPQQLENVKTWIGFQIGISYRF